MNKQGAEELVAAYIVISNKVYNYNRHLTFTDPTKALNDNVEAKDNNYCDIK